MRGGADAAEAACPSKSVGGPAGDPGLHGPTVSWTSSRAAIGLCAPIVPLSATGPAGSSRLYPSGLRLPLVTAAAAVRGNMPASLIPNTHQTRDEPGDRADVRLVLHRDERCLQDGPHERDWRLVRYPGSSSKPTTEFEASSYRSNRAKWWVGYRGAMDRELGSGTGALANVQPRAASTPKARKLFVISQSPVTNGMRVLNVHHLSHGNSRLVTDDCDFPHGWL